MYQNYFKRLFDLLFSIFLSPLLLIIAIPIAIMIKLEDRGPIFYNALRVGINMKEYPMYKFRTMVVDAPDIRNEDGSTFNADNDSRVTKVGKFLRKSSLDELPQLINVLRGEMSFVGPRPSPLGNKDKYPSEYFKKFEVRPGITGLNQALLRNDSSMEERINNDLSYIKDITFTKDIKIIFKTITVVLNSKGINRN